MQDPVLGTVGVQAELRGGVVHASVTGDAAVVGASLPSLHHYLSDQQVAVNSLTFSSPAERVNGTPHANGSSEWTRQDGGANASFSADRQSRGSTRQQQDNGYTPAESGSAVNSSGRSASTAYRGAAVVPDGSTLSIHI